MHKETGNRRAEDIAGFVCFASFNEMKLLSRVFAGRWEASSSSFKNGIKWHGLLWVIGSTRTNCWFCLRSVPFVWFVF